MPSSLVWTNLAGIALRSHTNIAYDLGGLRTSEDVSVLAPAGAAPTDTSGTATWGYDLLDRLVSYASPFKLQATDSVDPSTAYSLDDGGNVIDEATLVGTDTRFSSHSTYGSGRLNAKTTTVPGLLGSTTENQTFGYSVLGEETSRMGTDPATGMTTENSSASYDPAGHTGAVVDNLPGGGQVTYLYDASDHLISRTETASGTSKTTLYFYLGGGSTLAEEADGAGATKLRYLVDGDEDPIGQQSFRLTPDGHRDSTDLLGTWSWLLDDPSGNLGTRLDDQGAVIELSAYDPYGKPEKGASTKRPGADSSSLGYRKALTDQKTGYLLLGPRQYDPTTARFTSPDMFVAAALDIETGTDELTGNRYLFAAANPVSYFDDGHAAMWGDGGGGGKKYIKKSDPRRKHGLAAAWKAYKRGPDYFSFSVNVAIKTPWTGTIAGVSGNVTLDRNGYLYWGGGPQVGKAPKAASASLTAGWLNRQDMPSEEELRKFNSGWTWGAGGGYYGAFGETCSRGNGCGTEIGFAYPQQIGTSARYSKQKGRLKLRW